MNSYNSICFKFLFVLYFLLSATHCASGQKGTDEDYFDDKTLVYNDKVYDPSIKTVITHIKGSELDPPIIPLDGTEKIILRFDDLDDNIREMHYSFVHCTWDWKESDLQLMDYQQGFNTDIITDYEFSFNTVTKYTNYYLEFPNRNIQLTRSGNYLIKVFANGNPEDLILTARFMIVEPKSFIEATVRPSSVVSERTYKQEVDVNVSLGSIQTTNPYRDIELVVMQNLRKDNMITGVKPNFIKNMNLTYNYQGELTFDGGNEFRFIDAKSIRYRSEEVDEVRLEEDRYHIYLAPDAGKAFKKYTFENDINGKFLVKNDDMIDPHLESDYVTLHFMFPVDAILGNGDLYVTGQFSNWDLKRSHRMKFNPDNLSYELALPVKQGYYNYAYIWKYKKGNKGISDLTDGNHSEAENDYLILVYFKDSSAFGDRLIGVERINTLNP